MFQIWLQYVDLFRRYGGTWGIVVKALKMKHQQQEEEEEEEESEKSDF